MSHPHERWAAAAFAAAVVVALPLIMYLGREQWFFLDEWDFLADRNPASLDDLLRPHNEHWSTIPILLYRGLYRIVGLHHYWPYQLLVVVAHLAAAVLLRAVMRRVGVHPWLATAGAALFALLGSGRQNVQWGFQIGFTGALALGLAHLLLADHDGPLDRRDAFGLACGLAALMFSGIGVTMAVVVGAATLIRRGWKIALVHVSPLAIAFLVWFALYGRDAYAGGGGTVRESAEFAQDVVVATLDGLGQVPGLGVVLAMLLVGGAVVAIAATRRRDPVRRCAPVAGLLVGAVLLIALTAFGRSGLAIGGGTASRYVHLVSAMSLPAICLGASALARRWPALLPVAAMVLVACLPGNVDALRPSGRERLTLGQPDAIVALAEAAELDRAPADLEPYPFAAAGVTVSWLRSAMAAGRLPVTGPVPAQVRSDAALALSLRQLPLARRSCLPVERSQRATVDVGQEILLPSGVTAVQQLENDSVVATASYLGADADSGIMLRVELGPLEVRLQPRDPDVTAEICP